MRPGQGGASPLDDAAIRSLWEREYKETILQPIQNTLLAQVARQGSAIGIPPDAGPEFYARLADEGSAPAAYMAGCLYKNRLLGHLSFDGQGGIQSVATNRQQESVLETD